MTALNICLSTDIFEVDPGRRAIFLGHALDEFFGQFAAEGFDDNVTRFGPNCVFVPKECALGLGSHP
jgi:hypothetical protein